LERRSPDPAAAPDLSNLFTGLPSPRAGEVFDELLRCRNLRIERIVSSPRPEPTRYDQAHDEWVLLLQGEATLELGTARVDLTAGDHLFIRAHTPHRVVATSTEPLCVWLAVHLDPVEPSGQARAEPSVTA